MIVLQILLLRNFDSLFELFKELNMKFLMKQADFFRFFFIVIFFNFSNYIFCGSWNFNDMFRLKCHGVCVEEYYNGANINVLNTDVGDDEIFYILSTTDFYFFADYGDVKTPRLSFYTDLRFRYSWGSSAETANFGRSVNIVDSQHSIQPSRFNKHLLWMREGWVKMEIGSDPVNYDHYVQIGLIPFQIGRGISLGAAYDAPGFLGFNAGFAIDEYAPAVLLSIHPVPLTIVNAYVALIDNPQGSIDQNIEIIRASDTSAGCKMRGVSEKFFIVSLNSKSFFFFF